MFSCLHLEIWHHPSLHLRLSPSWAQALAGQRVLRWCCRQTQLCSHPAEGGFNAGSSPKNTPRFVSVIATPIFFRNTTLSKLEWELCGPCWGVGVVLVTSKGWQQPRGDTVTGDATHRTQPARRGCVTRGNSCQVYRVGSLLAAIPALGWEEEEQEEEEEAAEQCWAHGGCESGVARAALSELCWSCCASHSTAPCLAPQPLSPGDSTLQLSVTSSFSCPSWGQILTYHWSTTPPSLWQLVPLWDAAGNLDQRLFAHVLGCQTLSIHTISSCEDQQV